MRRRIKKILGRNLATRLQRAWTKRKQKWLRKVAFTEEDLLFVLTKICKVKEGDVLFVHSSIGNLATTVSPHKIVRLLMELVGPEGTILMPSYPKQVSYQFLKSGTIWDVRNTPSYSGLPTEIFRRMEDTKRSLHPTKSVAAWGALRDELICEHHKHVRPYSVKSPYFKFVENKGKAIGIGVSARYMAFVHAIDDYLGDDFPVQVYHEEVLPGKVIDYEGNQIVVPTLAHDVKKLRTDAVGFVKNYIPKEHGDSFTYKRRDFFCVDAKTFFDTGLKLAREGITLFKRAPIRKKQGE